MAFTVEQFQELKARIACIQKEADRSAFQYEQAILQLKEKYGVHSVKEAEVALARMEEENSKLKKEFKRLLSQFQEDFPDVAQGL